MNCWYISLKNVKGIMLCERNLAQSLYALISFIWLYVKSKKLETQRLDLWLPGTTDKISRRFDDFSGTEVLYILFVVLAQICSVKMLKLMKLYIKKMRNLLYVNFKHSFWNKINIRICSGPGCLYVSAWCRIKLWMNHGAYHKRQFKAKEIQGVVPELIWWKQPEKII